MVNTYLNKIINCKNINEIIEIKAELLKKYCNLKYEYDYYNNLINNSFSDFNSIRVNCNWLKKYINDLKDCKALINACNKVLAELEGGE